MCCDPSILCFTSLKWRNLFQINGVLLYDYSVLGDTNLFEFHFEIKNRSCNQSELNNYGKDSCPRQQRVLAFTLHINPLNTGYTR